MTWNEKYHQVLLEYNIIPNLVSMLNSQHDQKIVKYCVFALANLSSVANFHQKTSTINIKPIINLLDYNGDSAELIIEAAGSCLSNIS
jgi:hypothetical protein